MTTASDVLGFQGEYRFLSNFWPSKVEYKGITFPTVEHAYQAAKAGTHEKMLEILKAPTPGEAKWRGRKGGVPQSWEGTKIGIMLELLRAKFSDPVLRDKLMSTGNARLVESNTWGDTFWGVSGGVGLNWLGLLLMRVRREIQRERQLR